MDFVSRLILLALLLLVGPALGLGHGLRPPKMMERPPNMGQQGFFFLIKEKCDLGFYFFLNSKILDLC